MEDRMPYLDPGVGDESGSPTFELYHENSKQRRNDLDFNRRIHYVTNNPAFHEVVARTFKAYPGAPVVPLPGVSPAPGPGFEHTAAVRRSIRRFTGEALEVAEVARILHFGCGLTGRLDPSGEGTRQPVRAAPSGGALYPVEVYLVVTAVEGLDAGIYHYAVDRHVLERLRAGRFGGALVSATSDPPTFAHASVTLVLTGMFGRSHFKYGERSYRFTLLEAGHICQNMLLAVTELGLGAVAVGGFIDEEVNALIDVDGVDESVLYLVPVGRPASRDSLGTEAEPSLIERLLSSLWADGVPWAGTDAPVSGEGNPAAPRGPEIR